MVTPVVYGLDAQEWRALGREVVDLSTALLRVDTTNPPGNETACALVLRDDLEAHGFAPCVEESFHAMLGGRDRQPDERVRVEDVACQALFFERLARELLA